MKFTNVCRHCKTMFESEECPETFCPDCKFLRNEGTLRICDECGLTWIVEYGECGYAATDDRGYPTELCENCEKVFIAGLEEPHA